MAKERAILTVVGIPYGIVDLSLAPVMKFVNRGSRIPAPVHSFRNRYAF